MISTIQSIVYNVFQKEKLFDLCDESTFEEVSAFLL